MPFTVRFLRPRREPVWLAAAAVCAVSLGCQQADPNITDTNTAVEPTVNLPSVPLPAPPMSRDELLSAVRDAASANAAGADDGPAQRALDGRQFEFRIRFGCRGPSTDLPSELLGWSYQPEKRTIRVRAMPTISVRDPIAARIAGEDVEAIEGFWIPRPWLLQPVCPATAAVTSAPPEPDEGTASANQASETDSEVQPSLRWPKIGIAQFFTGTDPRTGRRNMRAYESVKTLEVGQPIGSQGFNLVLSGRLRALPGSGVIACVAPDSNTPPDCIVSAEFQRVWIENPDTSRMIAEWRPG